MDPLSPTFSPFPISNPHPTRPTSLAAPPRTGLFHHSSHQPPIAPASRNQPLAPCRHVQPRPRFQISSPKRSNPIKKNRSPLHGPRPPLPLSLSPSLPPTPRSRTNRKCRADAARTPYSSHRHRHHSTLCFYFICLAPPLDAACIEVGHSCP